jgi:hypothetical protein
MPKNTVTDPINDKEMAFAHLLMSGTMTDREAAQAAGLNPETASYTKARPRVRDYMTEHREAVAKKLVEQEAEGLRRLSLGRDQILKRLWELAHLSPEQTRGSITGQVKAMAMIVAIEGLIQKPDLAHRQNQTQNQETIRPFYAAEQRQQEESDIPVDVIPRPPAAEVPLQPRPEPESNAPPQDQPGPLNPFISPEKTNWVPDAIGSYVDLASAATSALRQPFSIKKGRFGHHR